MTPLPKRKLSTRRKGKRRVFKKLSLPTLVVCPKCQELIKPHQLCPFCKEYPAKK